MDISNLTSQNDQDNYIVEDTYDSYDLPCNKKYITSEESKDNMDLSEIIHIVCPQSDTITEPVTDTSTDTKNYGELSKGSVKPLPIFKSPEHKIAYILRVSSKNQTNENIKRVIKYCIKNKHWSVLEQDHLTVDAMTEVAISSQILRHSSFKFQQFSGRYAKIKNGYFIPDLRTQDKKNRQNSFDNLDLNLKKKLQGDITKLLNQVFDMYYDLIDNYGIAKECARFILPQCTKTRLFMTASARDWYHYFVVRLNPSTQTEHQTIASGAFKIFKKKYPIISECLIEHMNDEFGFVYESDNEEDDDENNVENNVENNNEN